MIVLCAVCYGRPRVGRLLCAQCARSYDRDNAKDSTAWALLEWAAIRARRTAAE